MKKTEIDLTEYSKDLNEIKALIEAIKDKELLLQKYGVEIAITISSGQ